jgi:alpha-aminoadipate carrier protein LysW
VFFQSHAFKEPDMSTATPTAATCPCPECAAPVPFIRTPLRGEVVRCPDCTAELEVTDTQPVSLTLAPQVEEDWGE